MARYICSGISRIGFERHVKRCVVRSGEGEVKEMTHDGKNTEYRRKEVMSGKIICKES